MISQFEVASDVLLKVCNLGVAVSGPRQIIGDVGERAHEGSGGLIERGALGFMCLQVVRDLSVRTSRG